MTKEEIRILSVTKLELEPGHKALDIGAGTGSVAIQMSKLCKKVVAIEKDEEALEVLRKNKEKFQASNVEIIEGAAETVEIEDTFHAIFVGGSGGSIEFIIDKYCSKLKAKGKMVLNFITIDNTYKALKKLKDSGYIVECSQVAVSKTKGKSYMLMANNPIFIVTAEKQEEN